MRTLDDTIHCPKCDRMMWDLGNLDNTVMCSNPPMWRNTWACHHCHVKIVKTISGTRREEIDFVKNYKEVEEIETPIQKRRKEILNEPINNLTLWGEIKEWFNKRSGRKL